MWADTVRYRDDPGIEFGGTDALDNLGCLGLNRLAPLRDEIANQPVCRMLT